MKNLFENKLFKALFLAVILVWVMVGIQYHYDKYYGSKIPSCSEYHAEHTVKGFTVTYKGN